MPATTAIYLFKESVCSQAWYVIESMNTIIRLQAKLHDFILRM